MKHARSVFILCALSLLLGALFFCAQDKRPKLYVYNWTYYLPNDVVRDFEKKFNAHVVYDQYSSNEEMFAKLKAGGGGYDVVFPSGDYVAVMKKEGLLAPLDRERIPNAANIDSVVLAKITYDSACAYSVPYMAGAAGVAVNKKYVKDYDRSWTIFGRADLRGRMTMLDDMREVLAAALLIDGKSVNTVDPTELAAAKARVLTWRNNLAKFDAESFGKGFAAGEFWVVQCYAENVFLEVDSSRRQDVDFFIPREGSSMYVDNMVILKGAKHPDLAHAFINYIHEPAVYARIVDFLKLPCLNMPARPLRKNKPNYEMQDLLKTELKNDLGDKLELYNKIWQEIQIGK